MRRAVPVARRARRTRPTIRRPRIASISHSRAVSVGRRYVCRRRVTPRRSRAGIGVARAAGRNRRPTVSGSRSPRTEYNARPSNAYAIYATAVLPNSHADPSRRAARRSRYRYRYGRPRERRPPPVSSASSAPVSRSSSSSFPAPLDTRATRARPNPARPRVAGRRRAAKYAHEQRPPRRRRPRGLRRRRIARARRRAHSHPRRNVASSGSY